MRMASKSVMGLVSSNGFERNKATLLGRLSVEAHFMFAVTPISARLRDAALGTQLTSLRVGSARPGRRSSRRSGRHAPSMRWSIGSGTLCSPDPSTTERQDRRSSRGQAVLWRYPTRCGSSSAASSPTPAMRLERRRRRNGSPRTYSPGTGETPPSWAIRPRRVKAAGSQPRIRGSITGRPDHGREPQKVDLRPYRAEAGRRRPVGPGDVARRVPAR